MFFYIYLLFFFAFNRNLICFFAFTAECPQSHHLALLHNFHAPTGCCTARIQAADKIGFVKCVSTIKHDLSPKCHLFHLKLGIYGTCSYFMPSTEIQYHSDPFVPHVTYNRTPQQRGHYTAHTPVQYVAVLILLLNKMPFSFSFSIFRFYLFPSLRVFELVELVCPTGTQGFYLFLCFLQQLLKPTNSFRWGSSSDAWCFTRDLHQTGSQI